MPASEIDEIFAKQSSGKPHNTATASSSSLPSTSLLKKKKKKKKELKTSVEEPTEPKSKKRPAPETIFDPSTNNPDPKRVKVTKAVPDKAVKKNPKNDAGRFTNSRGTGPRTFHAVLYGYF